MKKYSATALLLAIASFLSITIIASSPAEQSPARSETDVSAEKAVLSRLGDIQKAAEGLDVDKVFSFVLDNDKGALVQNGRLILTRQEALESTRQGFQALQKVSYHFDHQFVTLLSSTVALATGDGSSSATTADGQSLTRHFAQSVVLVLTNGEWKVLHSHRSTTE